MFGENFADPKSTVLRAPQGTLGSWDLPADRINLAWYLSFCKGDFHLISSMRNCPKKGNKARKGMKIRL
jgi:hypothetical protein